MNKLDMPNEKSSPINTYEHSESDGTSYSMFIFSGMSKLTDVEEESPEITCEYNQQFQHRPDSARSQSPAPKHIQIHVCGAEQMIVRQLG